MKPDTQNEANPDSENTNITDDAVSQDETVVTSAETATAPGVIDASTGVAKKGHKSLLLLAFILILAIAGGLAWYLGWFGLNKTPEQTSQTQPAEQTPEEKLLAPFGAVYTTTVDEEISETDECANSKTTVHVKPFNGEPVAVFEAGQNNYISWMETHQDKIALAVEPGCGSTDKTTVWLSKDGGESFEKVFEAGGLVDGMVGDQFTSLKFSADGQAVAVALLPGNQDVAKNTVKEIAIESGTVTDLFTADSAGVFLEGYDRENSQLYYYAGCYNCDGNIRNQLLVRNLKDDKVTTIYDIGDRITTQSAINDSFTKMLLVKGSQSTEGLGAGPPYDLVEIDLKSGAETELHSSDEFITNVGYRAGDEVAYYMSENKLIGFIKGEAATLFETENPLYGNYLVSTDEVIASTGDFEDENLFRYLYADKAITSLTTLENSTHVDVVWR